MGLSAHNTAFVTCPSGLQYLLENELKQLGADSTKPIPSGVHCSGSPSFLYRACLWSRVANRVLLLLSDAKVDSADDVYQVAARVDWPNIFGVEAEFAVVFSGTSKFVRNSTFGALKVKDAIVDTFREKIGQRPNINKDAPAIMIHARLSKGTLALYLDLSGESLHKRGYRQATGEAPLKENLAAAILLLSGWRYGNSDISHLVDPMCGSGTFLVEAAQIATDFAPGLRREKWGFDAWKDHLPECWHDLCEQARERHEQGMAAFKGKILGFDQDSEVIARAWQNFQAAGFDKLIHVEKRALADTQAPSVDGSGLLVTNPPYGERLGQIKDLEKLYAQLGQMFALYFSGWKVSVLTSEETLGRRLGWRSFKQYKLFNGALESQLLRFELQESNRYKEQWFSHEEILSTPSRWKVSDEERASMFRNRLKKNTRALSSWLKRSGTRCYRWYDADIPEFSLAIDRYETDDGQIYLHVQEYAPPKSIDAKLAFERLSEALAVLRELNGCEGERIALKTRAIKRGSAQYEKKVEGWKTKWENRLQVTEQGATYWVDLWSYLDTGLFLDHRPARQWVRQHAKGKSFLNLFCYTGSVTVSAVLGGAKSSLSIDMSNTYLSWAQDNLKLNAPKHIKAHEYKQADCLEWLRSDLSDERFDLIFLDPPSFSNSKRMEGVLDVQRDHVELIRLSMARLSEEGTLVFSNNLRRFKLDHQALDAEFDIIDWNKPSIDKDFERNSKIHQCWMLKFKA